MKYIPRRSGRAAATPPGVGNRADAPFRKRPATRPMSRVVPLLLLLLLLPSFAAAAPTPEDCGPLRIGILAKRGAEHTRTRWGPTIEYLNRVLPAARFELVPLDFEHIHGVVERGDVEFVLTNSAIYVELETRFGVGRIVTLRNLGPGGSAYSRFGGLVFTRSDRHDLKRLEDLTGQRFAAVDESSFGGYLMALRELVERGIEPQHDFVALHFAGTHDAVVYAVADGRFDAGTVRTDTLERMAEEGRIQLDRFRVIGPQRHPGFDLLVSTRLYPEWPLAKVAHTPDACADRVAAALLAMAPDDPAARVGRYAGWSVPGNYQSVREVMQELRIGPYEHLGDIRLTDLMQQYGYWILAIAVLGGLLLLSNVYIGRLNFVLRNRERELEQSKALVERNYGELRTLQKELVEQEKMAALGSVVAGVAHEVNTPLGVSIASSTLIEDRMDELRRAWERDELTDEQLEGCLEDVSDAAAMVTRNLERAARLVRSFKQISVDLNTEEARDVEIRQYLEEIVGTFRNTLKKTRIQVRLDCPSPLIRHLHAGPFAQLVTNLLQNALLHAFEPGAEGHVRIAVEPEPDALRLTVEDDGRGMTPEVRARVFEPFFTTSRERGGSGLGLHIVFNIVNHQFGGRIELESGPGEGSRFRIRLPLANRDQSSHATGDPV